MAFFLFLESKKSTWRCSSTSFQAVKSSKGYKDHTTTLLGADNVSNRRRQRDVRVNSKQIQFFRTNQDVHSGQRRQRKSKTLSENQDG